MKLTCVDLVEHLSAYLDDELSEELTQAAKEHLATCQNCQVVLSSTEKTITMYHDQGQSVHIPSGRKDKLYDKIAEVFGKK